MKNPDRIVEVEWEDSASTHGWQVHKDMPETWLVLTVGYVDREDDEGIRLYEARGFTPPAYKGTGQSRDYGCATMIARSAIRKVTDLGPKRK